MCTRLLVGSALCLAVLAGCGGSSQPPAGHSQAAAACQTSGAQAAALADQAATQNSSYTTLAADEQTLAASEATQAGELSDGSSSDDSGLGALAGADGTDSTAGMKVLGDCVSLGLSVAKH